jgi:hypothetical protein
VVLRVLLQKSYKQVRILDVCLDLADDFRRTHAENKLETLDALFFLAADAVRMEERQA